MLVEHRRWISERPIYHMMRGVGPVNDSSNLGLRIHTHTLTHTYTPPFYCLIISKCFYAWEGSKAASHYICHKDIMHMHTLVSTHAITMTVVNYVITNTRTSRIYCSSILGGIYSNGFCLYIHLCELRALVNLMEIQFSKMDTEKQKQNQQCTS